ncbi:MAG: hypothetical protein ACRDPY_00695 [Streptosporangiaceae bacterium]
MTRQDDRQPAVPVGRRPPDYVIVVVASQWVKDRFPAAGANLTNALRTGHDLHPDRDPEPEP